MADLKDTSEDHECCKRHNVDDDKEHLKQFATIGKMMTGLLHDFKFPIQVISTAAHLLSTAKSDEKKQKYLKQIKDHVELFNKMITNILHYSKGKAEILPQRVFSAEYMDEIKESMKRRFKDTEIDFAVNCYFDSKIFIDREQVKRVIYNLLENAAQAMNYKGHIELSLEGGDGCFLIKVIDNGPGISDSIKSKLFQSFTTHGKKEGTGLGLVLSKKIIEEHGGTITFDSEAGKGTTFTVKLPLDAK